MYFVRVAFAEGELETVMALASAAADPEGVDEGVLADGRAEYWIYFSHRADAEAAARALASYEASVEVAEASANWNAEWQSQWRPLAVGQRWWLVPPGDLGTTPEGRIRLEYHAGNAFGNGDHPTTQLCLEWMEELVRPGDRVLDLGCGSGLLCEAARALGAVGVGCDLDAAAVGEAARRGSPVYRGSIDAAGPIDVVVANLALGALDKLMPEIRRTARREAIVSGLLLEQAGEFAGIRKERGGWVAIRLGSEIGSA
jgi:ribosomal protein L11 methyltransferase